MRKHKDLVAAVQQLAASRFSKGEQMAGGVKLASGAILTSVPVDAPVDVAVLCAETGAICEAHKLAEVVVASACVFRSDKSLEFRFLPPCGLCQERLLFWGLDVEVVVPDGAVGGWRVMSLRELHPFDWPAVFAGEG
jgi:cytidine deaminase